MSIFISIAAYRDPQLVPTVEDCLAKARHPDALRFGICWQHGDDEPPLPFADDTRFRIIAVPWRESRGACWARSEIMKRYGGEDFFLQLDSHHRFAEGWDGTLLDQFRRTGSPKPILTAYATPFHPDRPDARGVEPMQMNFDRYTPEGIILFRPSAIDGWERKTDPVRARFLSAHFLFAAGEFVREVPYDPSLYFIGEEITLTVRAYSCGYDFFHPGEVIVWHEYTRDYREHKHWTDHGSGGEVAVPWHERDRESLARVRRFLDEPWLGEYGLGRERTYAEYEAYAGISFAHRRAQDYTRLGLEPPNPPADPDWASRLVSYEIDLAIDRVKIPAGVDDYDFWFVGFHDDSGLEIVRRDADREELDTVLAAPIGEPLVISRAFESEREPVSWTVWPHSRSRGWLEKLEGPTFDREAPATIVTALLDIGRDRLAPPFARSFDAEYRPQFERLLAMPVPMVVYVHADDEAMVWRWRRSFNTRVVKLTAEDLERRPWFDRVQTIRQDPAWRAQASWLADSPQAALAHYNPLVLSKMQWLADVARENPFGTPASFWMDAGLARTVGESRLCDRRLPRALVDAAETFAWVAYPYGGRAEIHGFAREALERYAGGPAPVVMRGGLFGGRTGFVPAVAALYDEWLKRTLADGFMGTEESLFTLLAHRYPELFQRYEVGADGSIAPFIDALLEQRARPAGAPSIAVAAEPPRGEPAAPDDARDGFIVVDGIMLMQNRHALGAFERLWRHLRESGASLARIVELGTGPGGLAVFLKRHCDAVGARFITYDRDACAPSHAAFAAARIDLRVKDITEPFTTAEIARELQADGLSILLCDGPNAGREARTFADYLKPGDLVLAHDYAPSLDVFEREVAGRLWSWCEVTDDDLAETTEKNALEELLPDVFHQAVWTCRVKRSARVTPAPEMQCASGTLVLYVQSFNAPDQFARWLQSVDASEPLLLKRSRRILLDNSTDSSCAPAYDALAREHGFIVERRGNLGITGGRVWCARHFDERTDDDLMVFFEDDMLLCADEGVCRNGLPTRVPGFVERAIEIVQHEPSLDFLKLSFTEFYGDHRENWAWYNVSPNEKLALFPSGSETRVGAIRSHAGLSYAVGEFHYSNWPLVITRGGNRTLFLKDRFPVTEQHLMVRALKLARAGALNGGVLLASPIVHDRRMHYDAAERKEA